MNITTKTLTFFFLPIHTVHTNLSVTFAHSIYNLMQKTSKKIKIKCVVGRPNWGEIFSLIVYFSWLLFSSMRKLRSIRSECSKESGAAIHPLFPKRNILNWTKIHSSFIKYTFQFLVVILSQWFDKKWTTAEKIVFKIGGINLEISKKPEKKN